jgi:hypothetical protein
MLEVRRDRHVVVHDQPHAIDSPQARCPTQPQVGYVTASQRGVQVVEAVNEGQLAVRRDVQVVHLVGEGASIRGEGLLPGPTFVVGPDVSQGRNDIERNEVGCKERLTPSMSFALSAFAASCMRRRMKASAMASSFDFTNRALSSRQDDEPPVGHEGGQDEQYRGHGRCRRTPRA